MKKKVCIVLVCYNAYQDAKKLLNSLQEALSQESKIDLTVVFSDNSTEPFDVHSLNDGSYNFDYHYIKNENVGYFPGFYAGLQHIDYAPKAFDYVIVSNVDLTVDKFFFEKLIDTDLKVNVGIIAPSIISKTHGGSSNPKIINRPSKNKLIILKSIFSNVFLFSTYNLLSRLKAKFTSPKNTSNSIGSIDMYAPHGAFIIFTNNYLLSAAKINYPRFLFGEEVFVAEEARLNNLKITYEPYLVIYDNEHGSTSLEKNKFISMEHVKSYDYLLKTYYSD